MAKKKKRGGKRKGAGRKPNPIRKKKMTVSVPEEHHDKIRETTKMLAKGYESVCKKEQ